MHRSSEPPPLRAGLVWPGAWRAGLQGQARRWRRASGAAERRRLDSVSLNLATPKLPQAAAAVTVGSSYTSRSNS